MDASDRLREIKDEAHIKQSSEDIKQIIDGLCRNCLEEYKRDPESLYKYRGGGIFLRSTWRPRKILLSRFKGASSRDLSIALSILWRNLDETKFLLKLGDSRLCSHCGGLRRNVCDFDANGNAVDYLPSRHENLRLLDENTFPKGTVEELEVLLAKNSKVANREFNIDVSKIMSLREEATLGGRRRYTPGAPARPEVFHSMEQPRLIQNPIYRVTSNLDMRLTPGMNMPVSQLYPVYNFPIGELPFTQDLRHQSIPQFNTFQPPKQEYSQQNNHLGNNFR